MSDDYLGEALREAWQDEIYFKKTPVTPELEQTYDDILDEDDDEVLDEVVDFDTSIDTPDRVPSGVPPTISIGELRTRYRESNVDKFSGKPERKETLKNAIGAARAEGNRLDANFLLESLSRLDHTYR